MDFGLAHSQNYIGPCKLYTLSSLTLLGISHAHVNFPYIGIKFEFLLFICLMSF